MAWRDFLPLTFSSTTSRHFLQHFNAVRNCADDEVETFDCAARLPWEAYDESTIHNHGEIARQDSVLRDLHRLNAHDLTEAGQFANGNFAHGFRSYIPQRHSVPPVVKTR